MAGVGYRWQIFGCAGRNCFDAVDMTGLKEDSWPARMSV